jgi:hypothetical protein
MVGGVREQGGPAPLSPQLKEGLRQALSSLRGALEQIQFFRGHASVQPTERYRGGKLELQVA